MKTKLYRAQCLRTYECWIEFSSDEIPKGTTPEEEARWIFEDQSADEWVELEWDIQVEEIE